MIFIVDSRSIGSVRPWSPSCTAGHIAISMLYNLNDWMSYIVRSHKYLQCKNIVFFNHKINAVKLGIYFELLSFGVLRCVSSSETLDVSWQKVLTSLTFSHSLHLCHFNSGISLFHLMKKLLSCKGAVHKLIKDWRDKSFLEFSTLQILWYFLKS